MINYCTKFNGNLLVEIANFHKFLLRGGRRFSETCCVATK